MRERGRKTDCLMGGSIPNHPYEREGFLARPNVQEAPKLRLSTQPEVLSARLLPDSSGAGRESARRKGVRVRY